MLKDVIDISRRIAPDALVYPGDEPLRMEPLCGIGPGCPFSITRLGWSTHFLTHIDPPSHLLLEGASLDDIPLHRFIGEAVVVEVMGDAILAEHVPAAARGCNVLFKTRNSAAYELGHYDEQHVYVSAGAAEAAVACGANLVGIDYLSVDRSGDETFPAHNILLRHDVLILEGIDLSDVAPGRYQLITLPLKIAAGDGSPVRAVLLPVE